MKKKALLRKVLSGLLIAVFFLAVYQALCSLTDGPMDWSSTFGGVNGDGASSLVQTSDGGYALAGNTGEDFWLVKIDSAGKKQWDATYDRSSGDYARCLVQTSDGGYALFGVTDGGVYAWLVKTDSDGNMLWDKTYGGSDSLSCMIQTSDGGYALAGDTSGAEVYGFWLVKTDSEGNQLWNRTYEGPYPEYWEYCRSLVQTSDGGYALAGDTYHYGDGSNDYDFWLVKTDSNGNMLWDKTYGNSDSGENGYCVVQTSDGGYALAGGINSDAWLVKTDSTGNQQWNKAYGGPDWEYCKSVVQTSDGGYALAGDTRSYGAGDYDFWLVKTDSVGSELWEETYGGPKLDYANALIQTSDMGYAIIGNTLSYGAGNYDAWLVKVPPESFPLSNGYVTPNEGDNSTIFSYYVTWSHFSTVAPSASVVIDGVSHDMVLYSSSSYIETYQYSTVLSAGDHDYWFSFELPTMSYTLGWPSVFSGPTVLPLQIVATPTFSISGGTYSSPQSVVLSCSTDGATIRYTVDGSEPSSTSDVYSSSIPVDSGTVMIKAKAFKSGMADSDIASGTWEITPDPFQYTLVVSPIHDIVTQGETTSFTVNALLQTGPPSEITLSLDNPPEWLEWSFVPDKGYPSFASTLNMKVGESAIPDTYTLYIKAAPEDAEDQTAITLVVNPPPLPLDVIAAISTIVVIAVSVAVFLLRMRHQTHRSVNFLPHVRNPLTDKAIAEDISNMERKLEAFKAKYPELSGIAPATSPEELLNKTRISQAKRR